MSPVGTGDKLIFTGDTGDKFQLNSLFLHIFGHLTPKRSNQAGNKPRQTERRTRNPQCTISGISGGSAAQQEKGIAALIQVLSNWNPPYGNS